MEVWSAAALTALGGSPTNVIITRIYVTNIAQWQEVGRAHGDAFGEILPVTTLVEIEAEAVLRPFWSRSRLRLSSAPSGNIVQLDDH